MKVVVLGGTNGFGEWLAKYINKNFGDKAQITITGRDLEKGPQLEKDTGMHFMVCNKEAVKEADVVIFAVPISVTEKVIEEVGPYLKDDVIMIDVTSIKNKPTEAMLKYAPENALVIPTHPMFGPFITEVSGQVVVLTPEEKVKEDERYQKLKAFLQDRQAKVVEVSSEEHDKMMSIVQGLTHFNMFVLAGTIEKVGVDLSKTDDFVSPIYKILVSSVGRYIKQNPWLYADIQMNNEANTEVYKAYLDTMSQYLKVIEEKDYDGFADLAASSKVFFGDDAQKGQKYTDKIIHLIGKQSRIAKAKVGKEAKFENIYGNGIIEDVLISFDGSEFETENNGKLNLDEWEIIS